MPPEGEFEGFRVEEVLSRSGTTTVYRAFQNALQRSVLIKELHRELFQDGDVIARFQREAQLCALIKHENVVDIYDYSVHGDRLFLVMEYVLGQSLADLIRRQPAPPWELALAIMLQTLRGLGYAHSKGVVHRDLKPSNILIGQDGQVKITDFGLAWLEGSAVVTQPGGVVGTPAYISPEAIKGGAITARSDQFSLGATFYELATGQRIFQAEHFSDSLKKVLSLHPPPLAQFRQDLPEGLSAILLRMLEKQPVKRWASAAEIVDAIGQLTPTVTLADAKRVVRSFGDQSDGLPAARTPTSQVKRGIKFNRLIGLTAGAAIFLLATWVYVSMKGKPHDTLPGGDSLAMQNAGTRGDSSLFDQKRTSGADAILAQPEDRGAEASSIQYQSASKMKPEPAPIIPQSPAASTELPVVDQGRSHAPGGGLRAKSAALSKEPAQLRVQCNPWADVYVDDAFWDRTPFDTLTVAPGEHRLTFRHPSFAPLQRDITAKPGEVIDLEINLWETVGRLVVIVDSWANIYINDKLMGVTPLREPLVVPLGTHRISLENPSFKPWRKTLTFEQGDPPCTLRVQLDTHHGSMAPSKEPLERTLDSLRYTKGNIPSPGDSTRP